MRRWVAFAPLAILAALAALFLGYGLRHDPHVTPDALVGKPMPATPLGGLDGTAPQPATARVKGPVLLNFFASWCAPCAAEAPGLMALKGEGVRLVGVSYKDDPTATRRFLADHGDPFEAVLLDPKGAAGIDFGVSGVPETFAVDARGVIVAKHSGPLAPEDADALLAKLGPR